MVDFGEQMGVIKVGLIGLILPAIINRPLWRKKMKPVISKTIFIIKDAFKAASLQFNFLRDRQQLICGFTINAGRVRNLRFNKKGDLVRSP